MVYVDIFLFDGREVYTDIKYLSLSFTYKMINNN